VWLIVLHAFLRLAYVSLLFRTFGGTEPVISESNPINAASLALQAQILIQEFSAREHRLLVEEQRRQANTMVS
jgi:hypothetical protein